MRAWKNKKGVTAYLVLVVGFVTLGSPALWANDQVVTTEGGNPEGPRFGGDNVPMPPPPSMPLPPIQNGDKAPTIPKVPEGRAAVPPVVFDDVVKPPPLPPPLPPSPPMQQHSDKASPPLNASEGKAVAPGVDIDGLKPLPPRDGDIRGMPPAMGANDAKPRDSIGGQPARRVRGDRPPSMNAPRERELPSKNASKNRPRTPNPNEADILHVVPQKCVPAKGQFIWNFEEEELVSILRQVSDLLCKTIVVNDAIGKNMKMTIIGKSPLTPKDAWDVLVASLASKGLALIEQGKTWTVVKRADSKSYATPMYAEGQKARNNEEIGTLFYKAQHASQEVLKGVARALTSKDGLVETVGDQFVIVIDSNSNIRRLGSIFAQVDIEDAINKIHILSLHNADAKTVEKQLRDLFDIAAGSRTKPRRVANAQKPILNIEKIIADERTNSLIVVADKESVDKLKEVVALVDVPASDQGSKGKIHVKKLRFADAKKIAETLTAVVQQGRGGNRFGGGRRRDEGTNELFEGEVKITAHENTNTLVTVASANDYRSLLATINKLDVRKEQVYVEAVILDIQVSDTDKFGINLFSGLGGIPGLGGSSLGVMANPGGQEIAKGIQTSLTSSATGANLPDLGNNVSSLGALAVLGNFLSGGVAGIVGPIIPGSKLPSFGAVLQAVSTNSNVDVLSTPYLLTTDNQQAEMSVGEKVPVIRGASSIGGGVAGGLGVPMQNIQFEDVKLTFKITPHVGADNNVRLEIEQEVNEVGQKEKILNQDQYRIRTKSAKTTLVLKDQQTGVIGGLMSHKSTKKDNKIPFLGDIPILGWLFKTREKENERRSLVLIITPYVIRDDADYRKIVDRKLKEREEFARLYYGGKIQNYNPHIEYDKKAGPLSSLLLSVDQEMTKAENGGPGDGSEVVITPKDTEPPKTGTDTVPSVNIDAPADSGRGTASLDEGAAFGEDFSGEDFPLGEFSSPESPERPSE